MNRERIEFEGILRLVRSELIILEGELNIYIYMLKSLGFDFNLLQNILSRIKKIIDLTDYNNVNKKGGE